MNMESSPKEIILFVHGFGSSPKCWDPILALLRSDGSIASRYEFATWQYVTKWVEFNLLGRIPRLQEIGKSLAMEIDSPRYRNRPLTLVGHSQGGLVIQSYIVSQLAGDARNLRNIKQVVFYATPSAGSTAVMPLRHVLAALFTNPQEATLRVLNPDVGDLQAALREKVVDATTDGDNSWRIPIHAFGGMQDDIVPEVSARGVFDDVKPLPGNHFTIIQPPDRNDPRYSEFAELLLEPGGHKHRFEVESLTGEIKVEPRDHETIRTANANVRTVEFDNFAVFTRKLRFSPSNRCKDPFTLRYGTRNEGYVVGHPSHQPNLAPNNEKGRWEDCGDFFQYNFIPEPGIEYGLSVDIYKGFDEGHRDVHFHLGNQTHYSAAKYILNLSAYLAAGFVISREPVFHYDPEDREHSDLCSVERFGEEISFTQTKPGVYVWEFKDIRGGIINVAWDLAHAPQPLPPIRRGEPEGIHG
jgi:pimeloyl-ACP methyl ester carboxylesterase